MKSLAMRESPRPVTKDIERIWVKETCRRRECGGFKTTITAVLTATESVERSHNIIL
jgi:hypothetical protein